jgi:hypothetical protein
LPDWVSRRVDASDVRNTSEALPKLLEEEVVMLSNVIRWSGLAACWAVY